MGQKRHVAVKAAIPVLSLLIASSLLVAGGQRPGEAPREVERPRTRVITVVDGQGTESVGDLPEGDFPEMIVTDTNCSFLQDPRPYREDREVRNVRRSEIGRTIRWTVSTDGTSTGITHPNSIPRRNFVDDEIFTRMASANIRSAPLSGDAEFLRRVTLDLTGRIPSATDVTTFLADTSTSKRDTIIDTLIASPEFVDKWTMFFGDLFQNNVTSAQVTRGVPGRDALYQYLKEAISQNTPYDAIARALITGTGSSHAVGPANWVVGNTVSMGPVQDTYDGAAVDVSNMFMGINAVDCVLCHDGARHLDQVNIWGAAQTRQNMWGLAAYFSQTRMTRNTPVAGATTVSDDAALPGYRLNTNNGNRVPRQPIGRINNVAPRYPFGTSNSAGTGIVAGETRRQAIARQITADLQFSRAAVNYLWERLMGEAFVTPSNGFDLARVDPDNPPALPWTLQPTNARLLDVMARDFQNNGYDLRRLIGTIVKSSAYQLSSTYNGEWDPSYVPYYARKYVRRMDAEEIHDAIVKATGITPTYTFNAPSTLPPVQWAMQLPDTREPTTNNAVVQFLNAFGRGDRDVNPRRFDGSVLQGLTLMNNNFVMQKIHNANQGSRVRILLQTNTDPAPIIRQLYLHTLSRPATDAEVNSLVTTYQQLGNRAATEDLQWVLLNRLQFLFNY